MVNLGAGVDTRPYRLEATDRRQAFLRLIGLREVVYRIIRFGLRIRSFREIVLGVSSALVWCFRLRTMTQCAQCIAALQSLLDSFALRQLPKVHC